MQSLLMEVSMQSPFDLRILLGLAVAVAAGVASGGSAQDTQDAINVAADKAEAPRAALAARGE